MSFPKRSSWRKWIAPLSFITAQLCTNSSDAQLNSLYTFAQSAGTYTPITGGTVLFSAPFNDAVDEVFTSDLYFNGSYHSSLYVSTNGFCTIGLEPATNNYAPNSNTSLYSGAISPFGTNLQSASSGTPEVRTLETASEVIVQWQDVMRSGGGTEVFSFQSRIDKNTGVVRFVYSGVVDQSSITTGQPEVGLRGPTTALTDIKNRRVATGSETWATTLAGTAANSKVRFTSASPAKAPAAGQTYTFTPNCLSPRATVQVSADCASNTYLATVTITSLGSSAAANISTDVNGTVHTSVGLGSYLCGPFTLGTPVTITVASSSNAACSNIVGTFNPATTCVTVPNGSCLAPPYPAIPDDGCDTGIDLQATIQMSGLNPQLGSGPGQTQFQSIELVVAHTYRGDLRIRLTSPSGQTRDLMLQAPSPSASGINLGNPNACPGYLVILRDDATVPLANMDPTAPNITGDFLPEQSLSGFTGNPNGDWILRICDASTDDAGSLRFVRLRLRNLDCTGTPNGAALPGSTCDDGNAGTTGDVYGTDCVCAGTPTASVAFDLRAFLDGCFDTNNSLMHDSLRNKGLIPTTEPYTALGFNVVGGGGQQLTPSLLNTSGSTAIVDWVLVECRDAITPSTVVRSFCALLRRNGTIVMPNGTTPLQVQGLPPGNYRIALRHRNHQGTMTLNTVALSTTPVTIDLRQSSTATYGTQGRKTIGTVQALWAGNTNSDAVLQYTGAGNDRDPILLKVGSTTPNAVIQGYFSEDVNLDGSVKYTGASNDRDVVLQNVGGATPNNIRIQQLP